MKLKTLVYLPPSISPNHFFIAKFRNLIKNHKKQQEEPIQENNQLDNSFISETKDLEGHNVFPCLTAVGDNGIKLREWRKNIKKNIGINCERAYSVNISYFGGESKKEK